MTGFDGANEAVEIRHHGRRSGPNAGDGRGAEAALIESVGGEAALGPPLGRRIEGMGIVVEPVERDQDRPVRCGRISGCHPHPRRQFGPVGGTKHKTGIGLDQSRCADRGSGPLDSRHAGGEERERADRNKAQPQP